MGLNLDPFTIVEVPFANRKELNLSGVSNGPEDPAEIRSVDAAIFNNFSKFPSGSTVGSLLS